MTRARQSSGTVDRQFWLAIALAALVLIPRGYLISNAHSERIDDEYHLQRGVQFLNRIVVNNPQLPLNDPPLAEALTVLPLWLAGCWERQPQIVSALWGHRWSADAILNTIGVWKSILFLPMIGVAFTWCRQLYGIRGAWLAVGLLLVEPNFAAHIPLPTIDVLGVEGIVITCYLAWRYFEHPSALRLISAAVATGFAMMLKHTAIILPAVILVFAMLWWIVKPQAQPRWMRRLGAYATGVVVVLITIWTTCLFDISRPSFPVMPESKRLPDTWRELHPTTARILDRPLPAGLYISSLLEASLHARLGHVSYLFGETTRDGWWYYFLVVATFKVPIGIALVMLLAVVSLWFVRPKWDELGLLVPMVAWSAFMMKSNINIGFRHFLPAYVFMLLLASRTGVVPGKARLIATWLAIIAAAAHTLTWHPNYLCYVNSRRHSAWRAITDSNVDWGQGWKFARQWIDQHPDRPIYVRDMGWTKRRLTSVRRRVGPAATVIGRGVELPTSGVIIVSPVTLVGMYGSSDQYKALGKCEPIAILGDSLRVYDLETLATKQ